MKNRKMRRSVIYSAEVMQEGLQVGGFRFRAAMITLTYEDATAWAKNHVSDFVGRVKNYLERKGFRFHYVWVAELQRRGAVHYHLMLWLPRGVTLPKPDKRGWWPYGSTRIEFARKPAAYLAKYASKGMDQPDHGFPKGCRTHARGGLGEAVHRLRYRLLPSWLKNQVTPCDRFQKRAGGYLSKITGIFYPSPWKLVDSAEDWSYLIFEEIVPAPRPYIPADPMPEFGGPRPAVMV